MLYWRCENRVTNRVLGSVKFEHQKVYRSPRLRRRIV
jgi:hypothetical protein